MRMIIFFFWILSFSAIAEEMNVRCSIFDMKGELIKAFPGYLCEFRKDGSRIELQNESLSLIDHNEKVLWQQNGFFHHDMKIDQDEKEVIVLDETVHNIMGCRTRFDVIKKFDIKTGKINHVTDFYDFFIRKEIKVKRTINLVSKADFRKVEQQIDCSTTHMNSFSQIDSNTLEAKNPVFKKGNWLVNISWLGTVVIFDRDFKKIIWQKFIEVPDYRFHDVQISKDGKLFLYLNGYEDKSKKLVTSIVETDPLSDEKKKTKVHVLRVDGQTFYQAGLGGYALLDNGKKIASVFSDQENFQLAFYDKNWNYLSKFTPFIEGKTRKGSFFQTVRVSNFQEFLKNYKGM